MVFNFYFDKIYVYKKVTTVVQSFYVDSLGVHLFIDIYLLSFVLLFSRFYYSDQGHLQSPRCFVIYSSPSEKPQCTARG